MGVRVFLLFQGAIYDASKDDHDESEQVHLARRSVDGEPDIMFD